MKSNYRRPIIIALILTATTIAVIGFTMTSLYWFLIFPPAAVMTLAVLIRFWGPPASNEEARRRNSSRKRIFIQLLVSLCILVGLLTYSIVDYTKKDVIGYSVLLMELVALIGLALMEYIRNRERMADKDD
jgi:peptidoglycan/LPS O-acetylase OafA/YrhL